MGKDFSHFDKLNINFARNDIYRDIRDLGVYLVYLITIAISSGAESFRETAKPAAVFSILPLSAARGFRVRDFCQSPVYLSQLRPTSCSPSRPAVISRTCPILSGRWTNSCFSKLA